MLKIAMYAEQIEKKQAGIEFVIRKVATDVKEEAVRLAREYREQDMEPCDMRTMIDMLEGIKIE